MLRHCPLVTERIMDCRRTSFFYIQYGTRNYTLSPAARGWSHKYQIRLHKFRICERPGNDFLHYQMLLIAPVRYLRFDWDVLLALDTHAFKHGTEQELE